MYALAEGLAGVHDEGRNMEPLRLAPRWEAAGVKEVTACIRYEEGGGYVRYRYRRDADELHFQLASSARQRAVEVLLPSGAQVAAVLLDDRAVEWDLRQVEKSCYACVALDALGAQHVAIQLEWRVESERRRPALGSDAASLHQ
jgi:hypothetical protein